MFECQFWKFAKKLNSTARPAGGAYTMYRISLLEDTNINNPLIRVWIGREQNPDYNYCYIPELNRYYFINQWDYVEHADWVASLSVDVLASYKAEIGLQTVYVTRSASRSNGRLIDNKYPAGTEAVTSAIGVASPWLYSDAVNLEQGSYIVGVDSAIGNVGSITYYVLTSAALQHLCYWLTNDFVSTTNNFNLTDASISLQRALINPLQFIKSCIWYPLSYSNYSYTEENMQVGGYAVLYGGVALKGKRVEGAPVYEPANIVISTQHHPQYESHGAYMDAAPFTQVELMIPPVGVISIDATIMSNYSNITIHPYIDLITGNVVFEIYTGVVIYSRVNTKLGVQIQLSQLTRDYIGAVTSGVSAVGQFFTGNVLGALSGIGNAIGNAAPHTQSVGSNGGFTDLYGDVQLMYTWYMQADIDPVREGKPLMEAVQINNLTGFLIAERADIAIACTVDELSKIQAHLEGGIYYE